jgi:hypothetical protein
MGPRLRGDDTKLFRRVSRHARDLGELLADRLLRRFDVVTVLQVEPELRRGAERLAQAQGGIGRDADRLGGDALDPRARHTHRFRQRAGRQAERNEKFLTQDFAGMERGKFFGQFLRHGVRYFFRFAINSNS